MPAKIICMVSAKGGSGKTVLTATFGAVLSAIGKRILLVDTDASTNGMTLLYLKEVMTRKELAIARSWEPKGIYEISEKDYKPAIVELANGCHLIPATYGFTNTDLKSVEIYELALIRMLHALREEYDYIILDAQAGSDAFAQVAMSRRVSDEVVIVSEYDPMSAAGVERLKGLCREDLTYDRTWVLLNKMLPEFVKSFSDFLEVAKYLSPIPWDAEVVRAYARRRLALDLQAGNEHTFAVMQTLQSLLGEQIAKEIESWATEKEAAIRQPIVQRKRDLALELEGLAQAKRKLQAKRLERKTIVLMGSAVSVTCLFGLIFTLPQFRDFFQSVIGSELPLGKLWPIIIAPIAGATVFAAFSLFRERILALFADSTVEEQKLEFQRRVLEEKFHQLEVMSDADLQSLLKQRK